MAFAPLTQHPHHKVGSGEEWLGWLQVICVCLIPTVIQVARSSHFPRLSSRPHLDEVLTAAGAGTVLFSLCIYSVPFLSPTKVVKQLPFYSSLKIFIDTPEPALSSSGLAAQRSIPCLAASIFPPFLISSSLREQSTLASNSCLVATL